MNSEVETLLRTKAARGVSIHGGFLRIAFTPRGHPRIRRSLGIVPTLKNIQFAIQKLGAIRLEISMGAEFDWEKHFPNDKHASDKKYTFHEAIDDFLEEQKQNFQWKLSTRAKYESRANVLKKLSKNYVLRLMSNHDVKTVWNKIRSHDGKSSLKNQLLSLCVRSMFQAIINGRSDVNHFTNLERFIDAGHDQVEVAEASQVTPNQVYTLTQARMIIDTIEREHIKRYVTFLMFTGIRPGEAAALKRSDLEGQYLTIRRTLYRKGKTNTPKTRAGIRRIFLTQDAFVAITKQIEWMDEIKFRDKECVWVTLGCNKPRAPEIIHNAYWKKVTALAGVEYLKPYVTRHCYASWMLRVKEDPHRVATDMGHKNINTIFNTYGHFIPKTEEKRPTDDPLKMKILEND